MDSGVLAELPIADMATAFRDSTLVGKAIVVFLFMGSAAAWTIMWTKGRQLRAVERAAADFLATFRTTPYPEVLAARQEEHPETPMEAIYREGCRALHGEWRAAGVDPENPLAVGATPDAPRHLGSNQIETLRSVVDRSVAEEALRLEDQMGMLATAVSAAPVLGLLGTVWGVMDAFSGMAQAGSAVLSAVAPGISGALLTTIIGLIVALPSMIGYNLLSAKIRRISVQMDNFAQELISRIQTAYVMEA